MATADVFCVFAEEAAAGVLAFLPAVAVKEGGRRFFEVSAAIALSSLVLGVSARFLGDGYAGADLARATSLGASLGALALGLVAVRVVRGPEFERSKPWFAAAAVLAALALLADAWATDRRSPLPPLAGVRTVLGCASALSGAALLGSVVLSMTLGHFYLVIPRLTIDPLRRLTNGFLVAVVARCAVALAIAALAWDVEVRPGRSFFLEEATILAPRALFGLAGPLVLCLLARGTVAIKSTQSATGILYGATVFAVFGELAASWLAVSVNVPL